MHYAISICICDKPKASKNIKRNVLMQNKKCIEDPIFFRKFHSFYNVICNTLSEFQMEYISDGDKFHNVSSMH